MRTLKPTFGALLPILGNQRTLLGRPVHRPTEPAMLVSRVSQTARSSTLRMPPEARRTDTTPLPFPPEEAPRRLPTEILLLAIPQLVTPASPPLVSPRARLPILISTEAMATLPATQSSLRGRCLHTLPPSRTSLRTRAHLTIIASRSTMI